VLPDDSIGSSPSVEVSSIGNVLSVLEVKSSPLVVGSSDSVDVSLSSSDHSVSVEFGSDDSSSSLWSLSDLSSDDSDSSGDSSDTSSSVSSSDNSSSDDSNVSSSGSSDTLRSPVSGDDSVGSSPSEVFLLVGDVGLVLSVKLSPLVVGSSDSVDVSSSALDNSVSVELNSDDSLLNLWCSSDDLSVSSDSSDASSDVSLAGSSDSLSSWSSVLWSESVSVLSASTILDLLLESGSSGSLLTGEVRLHHSEDSLVLSDLLLVVRSGWVLHQSLQVSLKSVNEGLSIDNVVLLQVGSLESWGS